MFRTGSRDCVARNFAASTFAAAVMLTSSAQIAAAQSPYVCADYARDYATTNAPGAGLVGGAAIGALSGALIAGAISGGSATGAGAAIGGGVGAAIGLHSPHAYSHLYNSAYRRCMRGQLPTANGSPAAGTAAWLNYCAAKYRSFNPKTGKYLAYSGAYRRCQ